MSTQINHSQQKKQQNLLDKSLCMDLNGYTVL